MDHSARVKFCATELFRARFESPPDQCCKILTGRETARESDLGNLRAAWLAALLGEAYYVNLFIQLSAGEEI
jgi:hypothetical protein